MARALNPRGMLEAGEVADRWVALAMVKGRAKITYIVFRGMTKITYIVFRGRGKITCNFAGAGEITYDLGAAQILYFLKPRLKKQAPKYLKK